MINRNSTIADPALKSATFQAGCCQHDGIEVPGSQLFKTTVNVSAQGEQLEIGAYTAKLGNPTQSAGANTSVLIHGGKGGTIHGHHHVSGVFPLWISDDP